MSRPRTPEHFPRMKVRGGRRRRDAEITRAWRTFERIDLTALVRAFDGLARAVGDAVAALTRSVASMILAARVAWWLARRRARDQWLSRRLLTAAPSPWSAPILEGAS